MGKYEPLKQFLQKENTKIGSSMTLTFEEIEKIIGDSLPKSASVYDEWWENSYTHSQAKAWRSAGYKTVDVNMNKKNSRMTFIKSGS